jgi:hypothetical protein
MMTIRNVKDQVQNTLDYLVGADLAIYANSISMSDTRVSWQSPSPSGIFEVHGDPTIDQYQRWSADGQYSAVLFDGSLLQITYDVEGRAVTSHRLAYIPCPYDLDPDLLGSGEPLDDIISLYCDEDPVSRSPIRFDFNPMQTRPLHPASHLTIDSPSCRIACIAPLHVRRFTSFVFSQFYPRYWLAHKSFFMPADAWHLATQSITQDERRSIHIAWDPHATATGTDW